MTILARAQAMEMKRCVSILYLFSIYNTRPHTAKVHNRHMFIFMWMHSVSWHMHAGLSDANIFEGAL